MGDAGGRPARVLWLVKGLGRGGAEQLLVGALPWIDRSRFEIEVAYVLPWKDALVPDVEAAGVRVQCLGGGKALDPRWVLRLRRLVRERRYDLIHTHMPYAAFGARYGLGRHRPVLVHTEHNVWSRYHPATRFLNARSYDTNAAVIAVSDAVAASIDPAVGPPVHTVIHGIDSTAFDRGPRARAAARRLLGLEEDDLVVGTVGNFTVKKDQRSLLAAFAELDYPSARLVLVGTGPLEQDLHGEAARLRVEERTVFTGSRGDVADLLPGFDVFALSSLHEGLPIALLEAMAAGLPVVATDVGGIHEALEDGRSGFLVPSADPSALASRLSKLLADVSLRRQMGEAAAEAAANFTPRPSVEKTMAIYDAALGRM